MTPLTSAPDAYVRVYLHRHGQKIDATPKLLLETDYAFFQQCTLVNLLTSRLCVRLQENSRNRDHDAETMVASTACRMALIALEHARRTHSNPSAYRRHTEQNYKVVPSLARIAAYRENTVLCSTL